MQQFDRAETVIRFEAYRVDLQSGELYKNGQKVKLSGQPFEVLAMLLARPGQLVTREELQKKLWPEDTFVDFDHSLNTAINKIREALGDSAENPHYVETLPRRGYRFIADVGAGLVPALEGRPRGAPLQQDARAKARAAYQDFLTLWKDADPDVPILKEAKAEYAKLK